MNEKLLLYIGDISVYENIFPGFVGNDTETDLQLWLSFATDIVKQEKEYLVYDFNGIVSSVGGGLGLFLGFSCLSTCIQLSKWILRRYTVGQKYERGEEMA